MSQSVPPTNEDAVSDTQSQDSNAPPSALEPQNSTKQLTSSYVHDGNGATDSAVQSSLGSGDDGLVFGDGLYLERLIPNSLDAEARALYCEALWTGFSDRASPAGLITMDQTLELIEELRLDTGAEGDEAWLLQQMMTPEEMEEGLTYQRVMEIFDDLGKRVNGEYLLPQGAGGARGGDGARGGEADAGEGDVIQVGPLEYLQILFRGGNSEKASASQSSKMGGSTSVSSQDRWDRATYKLVFFKSADISPRQLLLISTGALMIALCAALITGIAVQWSTTALAREEVALQGFHRSIKLLFEGIENSILQDHSNGMVEQATAIARYLEFEVNERKQFTAERNTQIAMKLSELGVFEEAFALENGLRNQIAAQVLSDFAELGATHIDYRGRTNLLLQEGNISAVLNTTGCLKESTSRGFGRGQAASLMWDKSVLLWKEPLWANSSAAVGGPIPTQRWCGIPTNDSVRSALDRALSITVSALTPVLSLNSSEGYVVLLSGDLATSGETSPNGNPATATSINCTRTSLLLSSQDCSDADGNFTCDTLLGKVSSTIDAHTEQNLTFSELQSPMNWSVSIDAFDGTVRIWGAWSKPLDPFMSSLSSSGVDYSLTILTGTQKKQMLDKRRQQIVQTTDYLNRNFNRSTEIVIALWNETNNQAIRQATDYRFSDGCLIPGRCVRFDPSAANSLAAFRTKSYGWSLTPDYRPEPVSGAYSYIGAELNAAIIFERDVLEMRGIAFDFITSIIDAVNRANPGSLEIELVGQERSPHMKQFYAYEPCPHLVTDCEVDPRGMSPANGSAGVLFRYNCRHCQRVTTREFGDTVIWQDPKFRTTAPATSSSTTKSKRSAPQLYSEVLESDLSSKGGSFLARTSDYRGTVVLLALGLLENFTTLIGAKVDVEEIQNPILNAVGISVGCGLLFLILGMTLLIVLSQRAFNAFEAEWFRYKQQIEEEQNKFAELVHGIIPPFIAERLMKGTTIIADPAATCSFVFTDICNLHETTASWTPIQVARFVTYTITVLDEIASECALTKLRSIGGCHVCVGHKDERDQKVQGTGSGKKSSETSEMKSDPPGTSFLTHPACRGVRFASLAMILFSKLFTHTPWIVDALHEAFLVDYGANGRKVRKSSTMMPLEMPTLRIGIHCGPAISGAFTIGKTSHYDFYGMNPALAHRMLQSAPPGRIHCTSAVKELVRANDAPDQVHYEFEAAKKLVVRGQGTVATFFARSLGEKVPPRILSALGISESELVVDLTRANGLNLRRRRGGEGSSSSTERSGGLYRGRLDSKKRNK